MVAIDLIRHSILHLIRHDHLLASHFLLLLLLLAIGRRWGNSFGDYMFLDRHVGIGCGGGGGGGGGGRALNVDIYMLVIVALS